MFNGNLVIRLRKEQHRSVRSLVSFVFGESSHITMKYFKDKVHIDSRHIEKLSEFFQIPIQDFFLSDEEYESRHSGTNVHHIHNSTVNINSSPELMLRVIESQKALIEQQADQIEWLREQVEKLQSSTPGRRVSKTTQK